MLMLTTWQALKHCLAAEPGNSSGVCFGGKFEPSIQQPSCGLSTSLSLLDILRRPRNAACCWGLETQGGMSGHQYCVLTVGRYVQALEGMQSGPLEQVPIQDYFPAAKELSPVEFA